MKFKVYKFDSVTSTNDVAINLIKNKKKISGCVLANKQTKGKGTNGKKWISPRGNLFSSLFFPLEKKYPPFSQFAIINPVIISNVIKKLCYKKKINLKFPNDIFLSKKKVCGTLQEVISLNNRKFLIIGIGININIRPAVNNNYQATSILFETKKKYNIKKIVDLIISSYEKFFLGINFYNYKNYKEKAKLMALKKYKI